MIGCDFINSEKIELKPFLKWAGGKRQILDKISEIYDPLLKKNIDNYIEPFVGGGAVLFDILTNYDLKRIYI